MTLGSRIEQKRTSANHWLNMSKLQNLKSHDIYLAVVSLLGFLLVAWGVALFPSYIPQQNFILLTILAAVAQIATTSVPVSEKAGITFEVGTAVTAAAIPFYGPVAASLIVALSSFSAWFLKSQNQTTWKKSWRQLSFNMGMVSISMFTAGSVFTLLETTLGADTLLGQIVPWICVAIINDQINLWLLIIMLRLQHGNQVNPLKIWRENRWAAMINILVISIGGGFLAFATKQYDWIGIVVFFLPIVLSTFAFRLYVRQMQAHMDNLEAIIAERTQELANLMKEKDAFLAVLSHDMKTPLTSISIYAGMLQDHPQLLIKKPHMVGTILRSQETLTDLVNNILDLEKLQVDGSMPLVKENLNMALLIESVVEPLKAQAAQKQIDLQYQIDLQPLLIDADRRQLERVVQNLVSNAVKYTPQEGCISVHTYMDNQVVVTDVKDSGYGIPADELPYIFDRFSRVDKHKSIAAGTGLGLAIAKAIMEAHNGDILVTSKEDIGSTFTIQLPLRADN